MEAEVDRETSDKCGSGCWPMVPRMPVALGAPQTVWELFMRCLCGFVLRTSAGLPLWGRLLFNINISRELVLRSWADILPHVCVILDLGMKLPSPEI